MGWLRGMVWLRRPGAGLALVLAALTCARCGQAQQGSAGTENELRAMSVQADVIFAGQVTAVRRGTASEVVEIDFAVEDAVRGVRGGVYTLREWAGLWRDSDPFRPGERYLMLLHAPGRAGLSSPVGGGDGAIPIRGGGAAGERLADLRWVAARVVRPAAFGADAPGRTEQAQPGVRYADLMAKLHAWEQTADAAR